MMMIRAFYAKPQRCGRIEAVVFLPANLEFLGIKIPTRSPIEVLLVIVCVVKFDAAI